MVIFKDIEPSTTVQNVIFLADVDGNRQLYAE